MKKLRSAFGCAVAISCGAFLQSASAGIALDAATHSANGNAVSSVSWTHDVTSVGTSAVLLVGAISRDSADADRLVTRVTYNGIDLTKARQDDEPVNNVYSSLWYLANPPAGAHTVIITYASAVDEAYGMAASFTGTDASSPIAAVAGLTQSGGSGASQSITSIDGGWLVDVQYAGADASVSATAGQTLVFDERVAIGRTNDHAVMTMKGPVATGTTTTSFSYSESSQVALSIASLRPVATSSAPALTSLSPSTGTAGTMVTVNGSNFGASAGTSSVRFNGTPASPSSWSNTRIAAPVPAGATTGNVVVTVNGASSNAMPFTVSSPPAQAPGFIQSGSAVPQTPQTSVAARFTSPQTAGNLNVVAIGWSDATTQITSVTDTMGNPYRAAVGPTVQSGIQTHAIFYAANIAAATANSNVVTVTFSAPARYPDLRIAEYRGIDPANPVDVTSVGMGSGTLSDSNAVQTTNALNLLVGANKVRSVTTGPGTGFASRVITSPNGQILEDRVVTSVGSYRATAPVSPGDAWIMQLVAFRAGGGAPPPPDSTPPTVPGNVTASSVSASQINVGWSASGDNVGVVGYTVYRNGVQVGTTPGTSFADTGLSPSTTYSYAVAAQDAAGNSSARSSAASATTSVTTSTTYPLKPSANGRYLVDQNGTPVLVLGDSARSMVGNISTSDAATYLAMRRSEGFNVIWVNLLCNGGTGCRSDGSTYEGVLPFTTPNDLTTPNEAYFQRVDQMLNLAATYGFTVMLDPAETRGWLGVLQNNGTTNARTYGRYLGNRYKNYDNLVWAHGNDFQTWRTASDDALVLAVALGIRDNDQRHIHTTELDYYTSGSYDDANWIPILGIDGAYTYDLTYAQVLKEYNRSSVPVMMLEANYEFENDTGQNTGTTGVLRRQLYWTLLSGGTGHLYGSFYTNHFENGWKQNLHTAGSSQMIYAKNLFEPRQWQGLVPDQSHTVVVSGYGTYAETMSPFTANDYVTAGRTADGSLVLIYVTRIRSITVDMSKLSGAVTARWYDPSSGNFVAIGSSLANTGTRSFTPPGSNTDGDTDWLLVLETHP